MTLVVAACSAGPAASPSTEPEVSSSGTPEETLSQTTPPATTTTSTIPTFVVSGVVVDENANPVVGMSLTMGDTTAISDADGLFLLEVSAPGPISVSKIGWNDLDLEWTDTVGARVVTVSRITVRGLRVGASAAGDDESFNRLLNLADITAVNALVFDTKQEGGWVLYDTNFSEAHEIGAVEVFYDPAERIEQAHEHGLYTITRIVTFEDSIRVKARPEEKLAGAWVDPRNHSAWDYNISLAIEACELGFDEIQFDYVRFPSGRTAQVSGQLDLTQDERVGAIAGFLARAREALRPLGCNVSADVFAIVLSTPDDQGIGQRPEELSKSLDALSPMVYPSHYSPGWLGFPDPNDHPYDVTAAAIEDALPRLEPGTTLRPWLQAFWWTNAQIRAATQAAEDRGVGWILWNARSNFDQAALPTDDEVALLP